jgi:hypothetical protein
VGEVDALVARRAHRAAQRPTDHASASHALEVIVEAERAIEGPWPTMGLVITPSEGGILAAGEGNDYLAMEQAGLGDASGRSIAFE